MSASLRKSLNLDMPALAEMLRSKGRGKDTVLAHITPQEAALLKKRGGRGSRNPDTGLLEFGTEGDFVSSDEFISGGDLYGSTPAPTQDIQTQDFSTQLNAASNGLNAASNNGQNADQQLNAASSGATVSYTHLTLPTILRV